MIYFILAAGLGANFIVIALLFRRLRRNLNRQLSDMRAERNSEWILRALQGAPDQAVRAANGAAYEPPPTGPQPVRRKRHLGLYIGGLTAAMTALSGAVRKVLETPRGQVAAAVIAAGAAAAITVAVTTQDPEKDSGPRSSGPTAAATVTVAPPDTPAPPAEGPTGTTGPHTAPSTTRAPESVPASVPAEGATGASAGGRTAPAPGTPSAPAPSGGSTEPSPPTDGPSPPPSTPEPPTEPTPSPSPGRSGLCLDLVLWPVLDLTACLAGGG